MSGSASGALCCSRSCASCRAWAWAANGAGRRRPVDPDRHSRDAGVHPPHGRAEDRAPARARGRAAASEGARAHGVVPHAEQAPFYLFTAFVFAYGVGTLGLNRNLLLGAVMAASAVSFVSIPLFGYLS